MTDNTTPTEDQAILGYSERTSPEDESLYRRQAASHFRKMAQLIEDGSIDGAKIEWMKGWSHTESSLLLKHPMEFITAEIEV